MTLAPVYDNTFNTETKHTGRRPPSEGGAGARWLNNETELPAR